MDSSAIDPSLRTEEQQPIQVVSDPTADSYVFGDAVANTTESEQALAQQIAAQGLPFYNEQLTEPAPTNTAFTFKAHEPKTRPRSCESCRGLKVKCEPNEAGKGPCKRCDKAGRECLYTETSGRRKKKQDNKVAELEKKVNGLTAALLAQRGTEAAEEETNGDKKRSRSDFEQDHDVEERASKQQALAPETIDISVLNDLVKKNELAVQNICSSLKALESWYQQHKPAEVNGTKKKAPTAQMGRTSLDLLSQVASNEKTPSVYSPYATADGAGYYGKKEGEGLKDELGARLHAEFGARGDLVQRFLGVFLLTAAEKPAGSS